MEIQEIRSAKMRPETARDTSPQRAPSSCPSPTRLRSPPCLVLKRSEPEHSRSSAAAHVSGSATLWQCNAALAQLRGEKDVICISGTGSGKTLTIWIPLLFWPSGVQIIITPLNVLGSQNHQQLERVGIPAIAIQGETASAQNFQVTDDIASLCRPVLTTPLLCPQDIADLKYRVVVASPELAVKPSPGHSFDRLWRNPRFMEHVFTTVFDEGHCVTTWSGF